MWLMCLHHGKTLLPAKWGPEQDRSMGTGSGKLEKRSKSGVYCDGLSLKSMELLQVFGGPAADAGRV